MSQRRCAREWQACWPARTFLAARIVLVTCIAPAFARGSTRAGNADFEFSKHSCPAHANTPRHGHKSSIGVPLTTMRLGHAEPRRERPRGRAQVHSRAREPWSFTSRFRSLTLGNR
jgi:hypothetical protein